MSANRPEENLLRALTQSFADRMLAELDQLGLSGEFSPIDVSRANRVFHITIGVQRGAPRQATLFPLHAEPEPAVGDGGPSKVSADMLRRIKAKATAEPQTSRKLIQAAGYTYASHTRAAVAALVKSGDLVKLGQGKYCLPRALPNTA